jgi:hypothetical protein
MIGRLFNSERLPHVGEASCSIACVCDQIQDDSALTSAIVTHDRLSMRERRDWLRKISFSPRLRSYVDSRMPGVAGGGRGSGSV